MTNVDHWMLDYMQLYQDLMSVLTVFPQNQKEKDDPERERLEHALWHRLYKRQIAFRLPSIETE